MADQFLALLEQKRPNIEVILGGDLEGKKRFIALAIYAIQKDPVANACTAESKVQAVIDAATCGLELGTPDRLAFLIPYGNKLQFSPSYVGMIKRLKEAGVVSTIKANVVFQKDKIRIIHGSKEEIEHIPGKLNQRGPMTGVYAIATLTSGEKDVELLELKDIEAIKKAALRVSHGKGLSPAWREFEEEMVKKSAIRRLSKRLPPGDMSKQDQVRKLQAVLAADNKAYDFEQANKVDAGDTSLDEIADQIPADEPPAKRAPVEVKVVKSERVKEPEPEPEPEPPPEPVYLDDDQQSQLEGFIIQGGWTARQIPEVLKAVAGVSSSAEIEVGNLSAVLKKIEKAVEAKKESPKKRDTRGASRPEA